MADDEPVNKKSGPAPLNNDDPILQGIDRVQESQKIESNLTSEVQEVPEDTHTKTNIHLGGRDEEGIGTGPQDDETEVPGQNLNPVDLTGNRRDDQGEDPVEEASSLYSPAGIATPEGPEYLSSGRAQPQVDIETQENERQVITPLDGVAVQQAVELQELENGENGPPVTAPVDLGATDEDVSRNFSVEDLLSNANDPDSDNLFVTDVEIDPAYGEIIDNGDGTYTFEPAPDFFGDDLPITYTISDGTYTIPGTAIIDVLPVNDPPTSADNNALIEEDTSFAFSLTDFAFSDIEDDAFVHITLTTLPENGTLEFNGIPVNEGDDIPSSALDQLVFIPGADENGDDYATFNFTVNDGTDDSGEYTFSIDVTPVNDPPASLDDEAVIDEDTSYNFGLEDFAFSDIDGDAFDHITITSLPENGELTFNGVPVLEGTEISPDDFNLLLFTPIENDNGDNYATFNFTVNDGTVDSGEYTFSIDVTSVNDVPIAEDDENAGDEDTQQIGNVLDNDSDIDGTIEVKDPGIYDTDHGSISINADGSYIYTPDADYNGPDSYEYTIIDDEGAEATATLSLTVNPVNDPPTSEDNEKSTPEDTPYGFALADFVFNDVDGDSLDHITITELPVNGTLTLYGNPVLEGDDIAPGDISNLLYTPPENASGENLGDFKFTVNDGTEDSGEYTFSLDVMAVADAPDLCLLGEIPETSGLYDISSGGIVTISATYYSAIADAALFNNSHGYYVADSDGNPIGGAIIQDNVKEGGNFDITFNTEEYPGGVTLGFFIVPDGDTENLDLADGDPVTFEQVDGVWVPSVNGIPINGASELSPYFTSDDSLPAFFSDPALNADNYDHLTDNEILGNQNWEDIVNGGDDDYSDLNALIQVTLETCEDIETQGLEGTLIPVPEILTALNDTDGSETLGVVISNIPEGVIFSDDQGNDFTATDIDNDVDVTGWNLSALNVFSPIGQDDFTVQVTSTATESSNGDQASATRNINVDILHAPETTVVDLGATPEDTSFNFTAADLLVNASDADGDDLFVSNVSIDPGFGTIVDNGSGNYTFIPAENYSGDDLPITYDITDNLATTSASAIIDVTALADTPNLLLLGEIPETSGLYDISSGGIVTISATYYGAIADAALFNNSHGYYVADSDGNPIGGAIIQDNVKEGSNFDISFNTDDYPGGVTLGFFIVPDGDTQNLDLADGDPVTFEQVDGVWVPSVNGVPLNGAPELSPYFTSEDSLPAFFSDPALNADNYDHLINNEILGNQNWEDIVNGGDDDYSDLNALIQVTLETNGDIDTQGLEGTTIAVPEILAALNDTDGSETLGVVISNIPEGVTFSDDQGNDFTATDIDTEVDVTGWNLSALTVFSPIGQDDFTVQVISTATEISNNDQASVVSNINVDIVLAPEVAPLALNVGLAPAFIGNESPVAQDDESSGNEGEAQIGNVLANDNDIDGVVEIKEPGTYDTENGSITIAADGSYTYTPGENYVGSDSYEYTIVDDDGAEATATLNLTVNAVDDVFIGSEGNDVLSGGAGNDTFIMGAMEGDDFIDAGTGASWTDIIELKGFDGLEHEVGWTLVLDSGSVQSTDDENGEMVLTQDADGTITFDDGGSITFENVEKIVW